jgi:hypothetical protein
VRAILLFQEMLGGKDSLCRTRSFAAACLALLVSAASLAPLSAGVFPQSKQTCCLSRTKCCHTAHSKKPAGPLFSSRSCESDCGLTFGNISSGKLLPPSPNRVIPSLELVPMTPGSGSRTATQVYRHALRQRPPPFLAA